MYKIQELLKQARHGGTANPASNELSYNVLGMPHVYLVVWCTQRRFPVSWSLSRRHFGRGHYNFWPTHEGKDKDKQAEARATWLERCSCHGFSFSQLFSVFQLQFSHNSAILYFASSFLTMLHVRGTSFRLWLYTNFRIRLARCCLHLL
jgi:hypothetical protein